MRAAVACDFFNQARIHCSEERTGLLDGPILTDCLCFCVGIPGLQHEGTGDAAKGNPYAAEACPIIPLDTHPSQHYQDGMFHCMDHTMGFAAMVEPLAQFAIDAVQAEATQQVATSQHVGDR